MWDNIVDRTSHRPYIDRVDHNEQNLPSLSSVHCHNSTSTTERYTSQYKLIRHRKYGHPLPFPHVMRNNKNQHLYKYGPCVSCVRKHVNEHDWGAIIFPLEGCTGWRIFHWCGRIMVSDLDYYSWIYAGELFIVVLRTRSAKVNSTLGLGWFSVFLWRFSIIFLWLNFVCWVHKKGKIV